MGKFHKIITSLGAIATIAMMFKFSLFSDAALEGVDTIIDQNSTLIRKKFNVSPDERIIISNSKNL